MLSLFLACPTCIADNPGVQKGVNLGIWALLAALGIALLGILSVFVALFRRQRRFAAGLVTSPSL